MNKKLHHKIAAIIVTFQPKLEILDTLIAAINPQIDQLIIVDNCSDVDIKKALTKTPPNTNIIQLSQNYGIGKAQNIGIKKAQTMNATHIILCDQDSIPKPDMVSHLIIAEQEALAENINVAAVGPRYHNPIDDTLSAFVTFKLLRFSHAHCSTNRSFVPCTFVIASGCLIRMECIQEVGNMDESLFIDHVDTDWCLRAQSYGYQIIGACNAIMQHDLGETRVNFNLLGKPRQVSVHHPYRHYYIVRNSILLYQKNYTSWQWLGGDLTRLIQRFIFFSVFTPHRWQNLKMMIRGIIDGLRKRTGKLPT